jgi:hypothetical protein
VGGFAAQFCVLRSDFPCVDHSCLLTTCILKSLPLCLERPQILDIFKNFGVARSCEKATPGQDVSNVSFASFPSDTPDSYANLRRAKDAMAREQAQDLAFKEQRFVESFNRLAKALDDFSNTYKVKRVIDVKKVKSIKEAYRNLERADAWFKIE